VNRLEIRGLAFGVDGKSILDGVDLVVAPGEIHALIGTNGTGKTTLALIVMGSEGYAPTSGEILLDGRPITRLGIHERARLGIALAWQEPARFEGISVADYVRAGAAGADAEGCLRLVGLAPERYLDRLADRTLSGGQRKRVELAAILALRPRLAMLDEPTSGIDLLSLGDIVHVIEAFRREGGAALLITHQEEVARIADSASELCGGRIVRSGPASEVVGHYKARRCVRCDGVECGHALAR
jgi:Fe-S cluster assembly ATP-binding protein